MSGTRSRYTRAMANKSTAIVFLFLIIAAACAIAYGYWWNKHGGGRTKREQEEKRKLARAASIRARGWQYDGAIDGNIHYRISGTTESGLAWRIVYDADQSSSSSSPKLIFSAPVAAQHGYAWFIHDRKTYDIMQKSAVRAVVGGLATMAGAFAASVKLKRDFYLNSQPISAGSAEFRQRYALVGNDLRWASLIEPEIERRMLEWPAFKQSMSMRDNCFCAELGPTGLSITLYADAPDLAVIEHMARLGQPLLEKTARHAALQPTPPSIGAGGNGIDQQ